MENFSCGCINSAGAVPDPVAKRSKYFEDVSASFALNHGGPQLTARYSWLVEAHRPLPNQAYIEAELENPSDKAAPIVVRGMEIKDDNRAGANRRFYFISPPVDSLECKNYSIRLRAYADGSKQKLIAEHENAVRSRVDTANCPTAEFLDRMARLQSEWKSIK